MENKGKRGRPSPYPLIPCPFCHDGQVATHVAAHMKTCPVRLDAARAVAETRAMQTETVDACPVCGSTDDLHWQTSESAPDPTTGYRGERTAWYCECGAKGEADETRRIEVQR